jgi:pimeloyl-ACP methyl ester carboxylesterase
VAAASPKVLQQEHVRPIVKADFAAYLSRKDNFNVILLDWSELSTFPWYLPAVRNVKMVADKLRKFLEVFDQSGELPIRNVHLVGFSLGSHIAGFAGKRLRRGLRIPRITALDPAFPEYSLRGNMLFKS